MISIIALCVAFVTLRETQKTVIIAQETASTTNRSVDIADENLKIFKDEILKQKDPLFRYQYLNGLKAFEVIAADNILITDALWLIPIPDGPIMAANKSPNLSMDNIENFIGSQIFQDPFPSIKTKYFIKCNFLNIDFPIPVINKISYKPRGLDETFVTYNLLDLSGFNTNSPYVRIEKENASQEEIMQFITENLGAFENLFNIKEKGSDGFVFNEEDMESIINGKKECNFKVY
jgi:hypothetical protein